MQLVLYFDESNVLQQEYPQTPILSCPHFRWVVKGPLMGGPDVVCRF